MFIYQALSEMVRPHIPAGSETEREKNAARPQAEQKTFTSMPVLRCHTTMIKRPKQSWSYLKGFCLYTVYEKKRFMIHATKKLHSLFHFMQKSNKNEQVLNSL